MNPTVLRYLSFILIALIAGAGGGMLVAKNRSANPPSGTTVAIPAQPFPGQGIPAIPAIPAQPGKGKPEVGNPTISFIQGQAGKNQVVNPNLVLDPTAPPGYGAHRIIGANFSDKNTVYWDGKVIARNAASVKNRDGSEEIDFQVPSDIALGSLHEVSVKSPPYGTSNTVKVQAVEAFTTPFFYGVSIPPLKVGQTGTALIWDSLFWSSWGGNPAPPLSKKFYLGLSVPASQVKSGAGGYATIFIPTELKKVSLGPPDDPLYSDAVYSFVLPEKAVYCPSWIWNANDCSLAPSDTMVPITTSNIPGFPGSYSTEVYFVYQFQYRGAEQGLTISGGLGGETPWTYGLVVSH